MITEPSWEGLAWASGKMLERPKQAHSPSRLEGKDDDSVRILNLVVSQKVRSLHLNKRIENRSLVCVLHDSQRNRHKLYDISNCLNFNGSVVQIGLQIGREQTLMPFDYWLKVGGRPYDNHLSL